MKERVVPVDGDGKKVDIPVKEPGGRKGKLNGVVREGGLNRLSGKKDMRS